jgi:hypothetical protein
MDGVKDSTGKIRDVWAHRRAALLVTIKPMRGDTVVLHRLAWSLTWPSP